MPTIIDSLIVEFSLDPKKFTEGQKKIIDDLDKLKDKSGKIGGEVSEGAKVMEQGFAALQRRLLAIVGLFVGGMGIGRFTEDVTRLTSASGRLTQQLNLNLRDFGAWERIGEGVGAASGEMGKGLASLQQQLAHARQFGGGPLYEFSQATTRQGQGPPVYLYNRRGEQRDPTDILLDMSRWWQAQKDKAGATNLLQQLGGVSPGMMNAIMLGPEELKKRLEQYRKYAPTSEQVEQFQKLQKAMADASISAEKLGRDITDRLAPGLIAVFKAISEFIDKIEGIRKNPEQSILRAPAEATEGLYKWYTDPLGSIKKGWGGVKDWWSGKSNKESAPALESPHPNSPVFKDYRSGGIDRTRFSQELNEKPWLREKIMRIAANEQGSNPQGTQAILESMMNRAAMSGTSLEHQARWVGEGGYYAQGNMGRGALENARHKAVLERSLKQTLEGGNVSNYATDNASQGLAAREEANGKFIVQSKYNGETFFSPGWGGGRAGPRSRSAYAEWRKNLTASDIWKKGTSSFDNFDLGNMPGADLIAGSRQGILGIAPTPPSTTNSTSIGDINVYSQATDGKGVARDLHADLARQGNVVIHSDTGLE